VDGLEDQRQLDAQTFGSVAEKYRFASGMRNFGQFYRGGKFNQRRGFGNMSQNRPYVQNVYRGQQQQFDGPRARDGHDRNYTTTTYRQQQNRPQRHTWQPRQ